MAIKNGRNETKAVKDVLSEKNFALCSFSQNNIAKQELLQLWTNVCWFS
jgi:hypothetical protein